MWKGLHHCVQDESRDEVGVAIKTNSKFEAQRTIELHWVWNGEITVIRAEESVGKQDNATLLHSERWAFRSKVVTNEPWIQAQ